jgi:hypothetical protein
MNDTFNITGLDARDGAVNFLYPTPSPSPAAIIRVSPTTGTLTPVNLVNESLGVASAVLEGATAESAAVSFIDNSFGMPSNAVLADTLSFYELESNGSAVLTGYEFIWNHANGTTYGGDAIKVDVEDYHYGVTACLKSEVIDDPPLKPMSICVDSQTTYYDKQNVSCGYRLWRSVGSAATTTRSGYRADTATIDAYTASLAAVRTRSTLDPAP